MNQSTLDAIRRVAERPGTEHEGEVARAMLAKFKDKITPDIPDFDLRIETIDEWVRRMARERTRWDFPDLARAALSVCPCGSNQVAGTCLATDLHQQVRQDIASNFKKGDRVFYTHQVYPKNCPATVASQSRMWSSVAKKNLPDNGTWPWGWLCVKFDHLKSTRQIPVIDICGFALSHKPKP